MHTSCVVLAERQYERADSRFQHRNNPCCWCVLIHPLTQIFFFFSFVFCACPSTNGLACLDPSCLTSHVVRLVACDTVLLITHVVRKAQRVQHFRFTRQSCVVWTERRSDVIWKSCSVAKALKLFVQKTLNWQGFKIYTFTKDIMQRAFVTGCFYRPYLRCISARLIWRPYNLWFHDHNFKQRPRRVNQRPLVSCHSVSRQMMIQFSLNHPVFLDWIWI